MIIKKRKDMIRMNNLITAMITLISITIAGIVWSICSITPKDPHEDEEQIKYLKEWSEKHKR